MRESAGVGIRKRGERGGAAVHEPYRRPYGLALRAGQLGAHLPAAVALAKQEVGVDPSGCVVVHVQRVGTAHCVSIIIAIAALLTRATRSRQPRASSFSTPNPRSPNKLHPSHTAAVPHRRASFDLRHSTATRSAPLPRIPPQKSAAIPKRAPPPQTTRWRGEQPAPELGREAASSWRTTPGQRDKVYPAGFKYVRMRLSAAATAYRTWCERWQQQVVHHSRPLHTVHHQRWGATLTPLSSTAVLLR